MVPEYSNIIAVIIDALEGLGFEPIQNEDFLCVLGSARGFIVLEGEPYVRGAFNLGLAKKRPISPSDVFSLRVLMKVFLDQSAPSLDNQLKFLVDNMEVLFEHPEIYEARYRYLNGE